MNDFVEIPLTNSRKVVKISPEDERIIKKYKWHCANGYAVGYTGASSPKKRTLMHRLIVNVPHGYETDHINRDKLDNRRSNLRVVSHSQNMANTIGYKRKSKYKGVERRKEKWRACIKINKQHFTLGSYNDEEAAARAYDSAALYYFKDCALPNFSDGVALSVYELRRINWIRTKAHQTSQYFGVRNERGYWIAGVTINGKSKYLGIFDSEEAAARAYDKAALEIGRTDKLNFPHEEK